MGTPQYHQHPNSNADYYRSLGPSDQPPVPIKHLQFIAVHEDGTAIVGGSNLTDRYWCGAVWFFQDTISDFKRERVYKTANTVCDAAFLDSNKFLLAEDGGNLQILTVGNETDAWSSGISTTSYPCQHYDSITSLAVFSNKTYFVTSGKDLSLKVWQVNDFIAEHSYETAHPHMITSVDVMPKSESVFVSTSMDCEATVWDTKQSTPARTLFQHKCGLTSASWNPSNENQIVLGALDGSVTLVDSREPGKFIYQSVLFPREVHKLKFHPKHENIFAGCCDDNLVKVMDLKNEMSAVYSDARHTDFVRGLAWHNDDLLTCSWDDTILRHNITMSKL